MRTRFFLLKDFITNWKELFLKGFRAFQNVKELTAFIFIRIIEVSFSLLTDFKKGMIAKSETKWKPEMNLPEGFRWVRQYLN